MLFEFKGSKIEIAIEQKIIRLRAKIANINQKSKEETANNARKEMENLQAYNDMLKGHIKSLAEYIGLPFYKKIFVGKPAYYRLYRYTSIHTGNFISNTQTRINLMQAEIQSIENRISKLEKLKVFFLDSNKTFNLTLEEATEYGLDEYLKKWEEVDNVHISQE